MRPLDFSGGFFFEITEIIDGAVDAVWLSRLADIASVENEPVMRVLDVLLGDGFFEFSFDFIDIFTLCQSGAVADAEDMSVDGDGRLSEEYIEDDIGCFTANAGEFYQLVSVVRNF